MKKVVLGLAVMFLASAQTVAPPLDYKRQVVGWMKSRLKDPTSVRQAQVTDPIPYQGGWLVCVEYNAKNGYGGYGGLERQPFVLKSGQVIGPNEYMDGGVTVWDNTCTSRHQLTWRPFKELEKL